MENLCAGLLRNGSGTDGEIWVALGQLIVDQASVVIAFGDS